ncbi:hypothetical protein B5X24_HaOG216065 [Helicoverpa armigera]|nr:hypothetical protein B5X24_HaOG216065 [Helicoverpa armigera]
MRTRRAASRPRAGAPPAPCASTTCMPQRLLRLTSDYQTWRAGATTTRRQCGAAGCRRARRHPATCEQRLTSPPPPPPAPATHTLSDRHDPAD